MKFYTDQAGFSMTEVIVASVIFVVASAGVLATIVQTRVSGRGSEARMVAGLCGKEILDSLNKSVAGSTWSTGVLTLGAHAVTVASYPNCTSMTSASYTVVAGFGTTRQVTVTVNW